MGGVRRGAIRLKRSHLERGSLERALLEAIVLVLLITAARIASALRFGGGLHQPSPFMFDPVVLLSGEDIRYASSFGPLGGVGAGSFGGSGGSRSPIQLPRRRRPVDVGLPLGAQLAPDPHNSGLVPRMQLPRLGCCQQCAMRRVGRGGSLLHSTAGRPAHAPDFASSEPDERPPRRMVLMERSMPRAGSIRGTGDWRT